VGEQKHADVQTGRNALFTSFFFKST
jgi:hypothetical protein